MNSFFLLFVLLIWLVVAQSLKYKYVRHRSLSLYERISRKDRQASPLEIVAPRYIAGENIPDEIKRQSVIYDMILVERLSAPEQTATGIFLPKVEGKDKKQLGKVLSVPTVYGLESEQGRVQPPSEICPNINPGDIVFLRDAWGIGPKDQEIGERKFSFHKAAHITGVIRNS